MQSRSVLTLVAAGLTLLLLAWIGATQPWSAPDEASHYLRALTISQGTVLGPKVPYPYNPGMTRFEWRFVQADTHGVFVAPAMSPPVVACVHGGADVASPGCLEATPTGDYFPPAYLLPAVAIGVSANATTGLWLGRLASALPCAGLIVVALLLLWDGSLLSLLGGLLALSPMVLFTCSVINPSGLEVAGSLAFAAAGLRIARDPDAHETWTWIALTVAGVLALLAWQVGPLFVLAGGLPPLLLMGRTGATRLWSGRRRELVVLLGAFGLALIAWLVYSHVSGVSHTPFGISPIRASLVAGLHQLGSVLQQAVGSFASLSVSLPGWAHWVWWLGCSGLAIAALILGSKRDRLVVAAAVVGALVFPIVAYAWVQRHSGFGMQGRYVLPVLMLIPLVSGEIVRARLTARPVSGAGRRAAWLAAAVLGAVALFQAYAWWTSARVAAGALGTTRFWAHATAHPPAGWGLWIAAVVAGVLLLIAGAATSALSPQASSRSC